RERFRDAGRGPGLPALATTLPFGSRPSDSDNVDSERGKQGGYMRDYRILSPAIAAIAALTVAGCISRTTKEVQTTPPPVVQVTPPVVTTTPTTQTTTITPAPGTQTSTTWDNGAVEQKNTVTEPEPGVVKKQTTTTWNGANSSPSETTT